MTNGVKLFWGKIPWLCTNEVLILKKVKLMEMEMFSLREKIKCKNNTFLTYMYLCLFNNLEYRRSLPSKETLDLGNSLRFSLNQGPK